VTTEVAPSAPPSVPPSQPAGAARSGGRGDVSAFMSRRRWLQLTLLLSAPMFWLVVVYLGAIVVLLISAFWTTDSFTGQVVHAFSGGNFHDIVTDPLYRSVAVRTIVVALAVTVLDAVVALPIAFFMSVVAGPRLRRVLVVAVLTPLWASYLVKAYAWRTIFAPNGPLSDSTGGHTPGYGLPATVVTLGYLWLPYMILPIFAGFERVPRSLLEASADLGARSWRTIRSVMLPLLFPAIAAGSIFTFSLSLGDYIAVTIVGGKTQLLANLIYQQINLNQPLAAALSVVPLVANVLYLLAMKRTRALENL
jgi:putative spermidine/putrescine transport system permease protein